MLKILVTGASGFVGGHLIKQLQNTTSAWLVGIGRSYDHIPSEREGCLPAEPTLDFWHVDLEVAWQVANVMEIVRPDIIFHLAGNPLVRDAGPGVTIQNVLTTHHLLAFAPEGCRFVYASSATVYGNTHYAATDIFPTKPVSVYGATKLASEALVEAYSAMGRVRPVICRLVANVGGGATHGVVLDLVNKLKSPAEALELIGDQPGSTKPYVHVSDTVRFMAEAGLNPGLAGLFNLSNDQAISVDRLADLVMGATGIVKPKLWLGQRANWRGDSRLVRVVSSFGFRPELCSEQAVICAAKELM